MPPFAEETEGGRDSCNQGNRERETCLPLEKTEGGRDTSHRRRPVGGGEKPPKTFKLSIYRSKVRKCETFGGPIF